MFRCGCNLPTQMKRPALLCTKLLNSFNDTTPCWLRCAGVMFSYTHSVKCHAVLAALKAKHFMSMTS